jgi:hypothetical protein
MRCGWVLPGCKAHRRSHGTKMDLDLSFHLSRRDMEYTIEEVMSRARYESCQQSQQHNDESKAARDETAHHKTETGDNIEVNPEFNKGRKMVSCGITGGAVSETRAYHQLNSIRPSERCCINHCPTLASLASHQQLRLGRSVCRVRTPANTLCRQEFLRIRTITGHRRSTVVRPFSPSRAT